MKNVKPELIVGGTKEGAGMSNATLLTLWADLMMHRRDQTQELDLVFVFLNNESTPEETLKRLKFLVGDAAVNSMVEFYGPRLIIPNIREGVEDTAKWLERVQQVLPMSKQLWVYADLYRTFRLGCTTGAGMVVPFSVEVVDVLADRLNHEQVRFRCAAMYTRLGD